jgi:hypothetical protein
MICRTGFSACPFLYSGSHLGSLAGSTGGANTTGAELQQNLFGLLQKYLSVFL